MSSVRSAQFVSSKLILKFFIFTYFIVFLYTVHTHPRSDSRFASNCWYDDKALFHRVCFFDGFDSTNKSKFHRIGNSVCKFEQSEHRGDRLNFRTIFYASNEVCFLKNRFHDSLSSSIFDKILLRILLSIR